MAFQVAYWENFVQHQMQCYSADSGLKSAAVAEADCSWELIMTALGCAPVIANSARLDQGVVDFGLHQASVVRNWRH